MDTFTDNEPQPEVAYIEISDDDDEVADQMRENMMRSQQENAAVRERITGVYRQVWNEFYDWEESYCTQILKNLASDVVNPVGPVLPTLTRPASESSLDMPVISSDSSFTVFDFDNHREYTLASSSSPAGFIHPHPPYESCAPSGCIVSSPDIFDSDEKDMPRALHFIKYAGEPGFPELTYVDHFSVLSWQMELRDPDRA